MEAVQDALKNFGIVRLALTAAILLGVVSGFYYLVNHFSQPEKGLLYSDLEMADAAKIVQRLEGMGVPVDLRGGGTQIFVPADKVARMRLEMAEAGLPKSGNLGYEIFDREESFGTSSFVQGINHLRALEGELSRTIGSLAQVASARVHLVMPKRKLFSRENDEPSASIMLSLAGPGRLPASKVAAIQQLVAAAVPGLSPERISIVDDRGNLLARVDTDPGVLTASNLDERKASLENRLSQTIESLVSKYVGEGKVRAEVAIDMDYDHFTENSETYDPDGQVIRSSQSVSSGDQEEGSSPQPVTAASNQPGKQESTAKTSTKSNRKEETLNYEVSRKVKTHVHESGAVKRVTVAVLIDGIYKPQKGKEPIWEPRPDSEINQLTKLVRNAIGFNKERGDSVEVINMRFAPIEINEVTAKEEGFLGLSKQDIIRIVEVFVIGLIALLILLLVVKPMANRILEGTGNAAGMLNVSGVDGGTSLIPGQTSLAALPAANQQTLLPEGENGNTPTLPASSQLEKMVTIKQIEGQIRESSLKTVGDIIDNHTDEAVAVIHSWITKTD